jgi:hypothetical protein
MAAPITAIDSSLAARVLSMSRGVSRLNLSHNQIADATEEALVALSALVYLNVSFNSLTTLHSGWACLRTIEVLDVSHNAISDVSGLQGLVSLRRLDLSHNCLSAWAQVEALGGLSQLASLQLAGNPVSSMLPPAQYEAYLRSLFPHLQRVDDVATAGGRGPGSAATATRTVLVGGERTVGEAELLRPTLSGPVHGHGTPVRPASMSGPNTQTQGEGAGAGGGERKTPRLQSLVAYADPPAYVEQQSESELLELQQRVLEAEGALAAQAEENESSRRAVAAANAELAATTAELQKKIATISAQADVLAEYERTLSAAYVARAAAAEEVTPDEEGAPLTLDPEQEAQLHADAYGDTLIALRMTLTEALVGLHSAEARLESAGKDAAFAAAARAETRLAEQRAEAEARSAANAHTIAALRARLEQVEAASESAAAASTARATSLFSMAASAREEADALQQQLLEEKARGDRARRALAAAESSAREASALVRELHEREESSAAMRTGQMARLSNEGDSRLLALQQELGAAKLEAWTARQDAAEARTRAGMDTCRSDMLEARLAELQAQAASSSSAASHARMREASVASQMATLASVVRVDLPLAAADMTSHMEALRGFAEDALAVMAARVSILTERIAVSDLARTADASAITEALASVQAERAHWADCLTARAARMAAEESLLEEAAERRVLAAGFAGASLDAEHASGEEEEDDSDAEVVGARRAPRTAAVTAVDRAAAASALGGTLAKLDALRAAHEAVVVATADALAAACERTDAALLDALGVEAEDEGVRSGEGMRRPSIASAASRASGVPWSSAGSVAGGVGPGEGAICLMDARSLRGHLEVALAEKRELAGQLARAARAASLREAASIASLTAQLAQARAEAGAAAMARDEIARELRACEARAEGERRVMGEAAQRAESTRSKQVAVAKEAAMRARAASASLESSLATARTDAESATANARRLERELVRVSETTSAEHARLVDQFAGRLSDATAAIAEAKAAAEAAAAVADKRGAEAGRLSEAVAGLKRERAALLAALEVPAPQ